MSISKSESYAKAGVDVTAGYKAVELMKAHVARTTLPGVLTGIGGFGGLFEMDLTGIKKPVLENKNLSGMFVITSKIYSVTVNESECSID